MATNPLNSNDYDQIEGIGTGTNMNSEKPYTYDTVDSLHPSGIYEQVGAAKESQRKYDLYDKLPPTRKIYDISDSQSDDEIPSGLPTVILDADQKNDKPTVEATHHDDETIPSIDDHTYANHNNNPSVEATHHDDETIPSIDDHTYANHNNNPSLHYADLQILPAASGAFVAKDDSRTPYALVIKT